MTELAGALTSRLRTLWGPAVAVTEVRPMPGGASRESWDVRVRASNGTERRLILLRDAGGRARTPQRNVAVEAAAMIEARTAGVPVAELFDHGEGTLGRAYLLMERLDGETIPRRLLRDDAYAAARPGLARRLGEVLARITGSTRARSPDSRRSTRSASSPSSTRASPSPGPRSNSACARCASTSPLPSRTPWSTGTSAPAT